MPRFFVAIHHPDDYDPAVAEDHTVRAAINELNEQMVAAGVRVFEGGLRPAGLAKSIRMVSPEQTKVSGGAYLACNEHVGGFWILEVADEETAIEWGRKAAIACRAPVEVREFH